MTSIAPPAPPEERRAPHRHDSPDAQVLGGLLILAGVLLLAMRSGVVSLSWQALMSILLVALGAGMILTVRRRGGPSLVVVGVVMTIVLVSASSIDVGLLNEGVGDRVIVPASLAEVDRSVSLGVGRLEVDLSAVEFPDGTTLRYEVGVGELHLVLPADEDMKTRVRVQVRAGELDVLGTARSGPKLAVTVPESGYESAPRKLDVVVSLGLGNVQVRRARI